MFSLSPGHESRSVVTEYSKNYNGIDLVKFLCAIMVFTIHVTPFQGQLSDFFKYANYGLQRYLCRLAVPFYFICSGFFLFGKMPLYELDTKAIQKYCYKILRLLGIWHILLFIGGTTHLWYLQATVVAVILLGLCFHFRIRLRYICVIACLLYAIGLLGDSYYGIIAPLENHTIFKYLFKGYSLAFKTTRNGVFMGFIFILIGAVFSNYRIELKLRTSLTGFVLSALCLFAEVVLLIYNDIPAQYNMYIFLVPAAFFLFSIAYTVQLKDRPIYKHLRRIGLFAFFSHFLVNKLVLLAISFIHKHWGIYAQPYQYFISLFFTFLLAVCIDWLSYKEKFKWIVWCIS